MYIDLAKPTTYTSHNENMFPCISLGHGEINVSTWGFNDSVICKYGP